MVSTSMKFQPISKPSMITQLPLIKEIGKLENSFEKLEIKEESVKNDLIIKFDSVMRKRRYKIKKHKFRKRRRATKALRRRLRK